MLFDRSDFSNSIDKGCYTRSPRGVRAKAKFKCPKAKFLKVGKRSKIEDRMIRDMQGC